MYYQHAIYSYFDHLRNCFTNYRHIIINKDVFTKTATISWNAFDFTHPPWSWLRLMVVLFLFVKYYPRFNYMAAFIPLFIQFIYKSISPENSIGFYILLNYYLTFKLFFKSLENCITFQTSNYYLWLKHFLLGLLYSWQDKIYH